MKLTRQQEVVLIGIGLSTVLNSLPLMAKAPKTKRKKSGAKWTPERREKFSQTMKKKWSKKK